MDYLVPGQSIADPRCIECHNDCQINCDPDCVSRCDVCGAHCDPVCPIDLCIFKLP